MKIKIIAIVMMLMIMCTTTALAYELPVEPPEDTYINKVIYINSNGYIMLFTWEETEKGTLYKTENINEYQIFAHTKYTEHRLRADNNWVELDKGDTLEDYYKFKTEDIKYCSIDITNTDGTMYRPADKEETEPLPPETDENEGNNDLLYSTDIKSVYDSFLGVISILLNVGIVILAMYASITLIKRIIHKFV